MLNIFENLSIGYSPVWRQLWTYNTHKIIGQGGSWRPIISRPIPAPNRAMCFIPLQYAIKSHLISLSSNRSHSTILISIYCKNCENTISGKSPSLQACYGDISLAVIKVMAHTPLYNSPTHTL